MANSNQKPVRLPSVRQLAVHLGVSTSTVMSVYGKLKERGLIESVAGSGSHLKGTPVSQPIRVTTNVPTAEAMQSGSWYAELMGGLTVAAFKSGKMILLRAMDAMLDEEPDLSPQYREVALVFPAQSCRQKLLDWASAHRISTIFLNRVDDNSTENFVSADYFGTSRQLGRAFLQSGRKRILFIAHTPLSAVTSNRLRISGLLAGLNYGSDNGVHFEMIFTNSETNREAGRQGLLQYLEKHGTYPDAIYAPADFMAVGCYLELRERGIAVPEQVSIVGGTGLMLDRSGCPLLTRMSHPYEALGKELVTMLLDQLAHPDRPCPGRILPMCWLGGATTTEQENALLFAP